MQLPGERQETSLMNFHNYYQRGTSDLETYNQMSTSPSQLGLQIPRVCGNMDPTLIELTHKPVQFGPIHHCKVSIR